MTTDRAAFEAALNNAMDLASQPTQKQSDAWVALFAIYDALRAELEAAKAERDRLKAQVEDFQNAEDGLGRNRVLLQYRSVQRLPRWVAGRGPWHEDEAMALVMSHERLTAENERLRAALRTIRGFDDTWAHRGHEPSDVGHECRMCWIMRTVAAALVPRETTP